MSGAADVRHAAEPPYAARVIENPSQTELQALSLKHIPHIYRSRFGNLDRITRCKARMAQCTYIIAPVAEQGFYSSKVMGRETATALIDLQRSYIEKVGTLIRIDGYQGLGPHATAVQWLYTPEAANVAAMQQILAFPRAAVEGAAPPAAFHPQFRLVMTPGCPAPVTPNGVAILVDLENRTTHVLGSDYFGECKKGMLRMLNEHVYQEGGLVLHAGAKAVTLGGRTVALAVMGLSGTGKTTTTFSLQGDATRPIQDDMLALWPDGTASVTENGCFAKTYGLLEASEPIIYRGTVHAGAWVENVYLDLDGGYDFSKDALTPTEVDRWRPALLDTGAPPDNLEAYVRGKVKLEDLLDENGVPRDGWDFVVWTQNGRSIIPMSAISGAASLDRLPAIESLGILNRDEGEDAATPGLVRFTSPDQAAAYFMLGETSKTSAAGKERGKTRSPFTQPFFPRAPYLQARRFAELAARMPDLQLWLMNTGFVGGEKRDVAAGRALKVKIAHSSAMLEALLADRIVWCLDPDFGYRIVDVEARENAPLLERVPAEILAPARFYAAQGREAQYRAWVGRIKEERRAFLRKMGVADAILAEVR
jgi:phosphoenolpyruvate carboxykinase (ATP)